VMVAIDEVIIQCYEPTRLAKKLGQPKDWAAEEPIAKSIDFFEKDALPEKQVYP